MVSLGIAVVGAGDVATRDYLPEFHRLAGRAHLAIVASRTADRARAVAEAYGVPWTIDVAEAIGRDDVDIVCNLTPAAAHLDVTLAAVRAGKHVYCEKPVATNPADTQLIASAALEAGVTVAAAPSVVLFPQVRRMIEMVHGGAVGPVTAVVAFANGGVPPWAGFTTDPSHFFAAGSGPWRDMGVYPLHVLEALVGPVVEVSATSRRTIDSFVLIDGPMAGVRVPVESDDDWHVTALTRTGVIADLHASFASAGTFGPEFEVRGREGTLAASLLDVSAPLWLKHSDSTEVEEIHVPHERAEGPDHLLGLADLVDHVLDGTPLSIPLESAAHVLSVIVAAEQSALERRAIQVV
jgi:predicted dehydrogenase